MILLSFFEALDTKEGWDFEYPVLFIIPGEELSIVNAAVRFFDDHADIEEIKVRLDEKIVRAGFLVLDPTAPDLSGFIGCLVIVESGVYLRLTYEEMISGYGNVYRSAETSQDMFPEEDDHSGNEYPGPRNFDPGQVVIDEDFIERFNEMTEDKQAAAFEMLLKAGYDAIVAEIKTQLEFRRI